MVSAAEKRMSLEDKQVVECRAEVERKDTIIMQMVQRIHELEPAPEARESRVAGDEDAGNGTLGPQDGSQQCSWWRRFFGM